MKEPKKPKKASARDGRIDSRLSQRDEIYREFFDNSPIGIWEEDWSLLKEMIDRLQEQGVTDWQRHFTVHEDQLTEAYDLARLTHINQAALDIYQVPNRQDAINITASEFIMPEELPEFRNNLVAFIEGQTSYEINSTERTFNDSEILTRRICTISPDHLTSWSRVQYTIEDITERKRLEMLLRESDARYREVIENAPVALWTEDWSRIKKMVDRLTEEGVENWRAYLTEDRGRAIAAYDMIEIQQLSNQNLNLYGATSRQEYIGSIQGATVPPEELDAFVEILLSFIKGQWTIDVTSWDVRMDGSKIKIRTRGFVPVAYRHDWSHLIYSLEDITEHDRMETSLRESEARYREIFSGAPIALWVEDWSPLKRMIDSLTAQGVVDLRAYFADRRDRIVHAYNLVEVVQASKASLQLYGAKDIPDYIGANRGDLALPEKLDAFVDILLGFIDGHWIVDIDSLDAKLDGSRMMIRMRGIVPPAHRHDWSRLICSLDDITERKRTDEALKSALEQTAFANRAMTDFLAHMSHELRTPLNAIIGFSDIMKHELLGAIGNQRYLDYANDINESGIHLLKIIGDILDLSKIESGKAELHEENVDVMKALGSCLTIVETRAQEAGVVFACDAAANVPALYADELKLKQIMINILSNAINFTPSGGTITTNVAHDSDSGFAIRISDTGIGMALEDIPKALAPFQQIDSAAKGRNRGTGLGLPLTKILVELHGGSLEIDSKLDYGTTVTVRFPAERIVENHSPGATI